MRGVISGGGGRDGDGGLGAAVADGERDGGGAGDGGGAAELWLADGGGERERQRQDVLVAGVCGRPDPAAQAGGDLPLRRHAMSVVRGEPRLIARLLL